MAAIGGIIGAVGSVVGAMGQASEAQYQAQVARNNAKIAEQNAQYASVAGSREEEAYRIKATNLRSTQKAAFATSGVDVNIGSPFRIQVGSKVLEQLDAATIRNNTFRKVYDYKSQKMQYKAQAGLYDLQAQNAMTAGLFNAAGGLVSSVGSVAPKWNSWRSPTSYTPVSYGPSLASPPMAVPLVQSSGSAQYGPMLGGMSARYV